MELPEKIAHPFIVIFTTVLMAILVFIIATIPAPAAISPEPAPQCKARKHCKVKWDKRPFVYNSWGWLTSEDGTRVKIRIRCVVNPRNGNTLCSVRIPL